MKDFAFLKTVDCSYTDQSLELEGVLPEEVQGDLFRVGAHRFDMFGETHRHWFDGDAGVVKISFGGGAARASYRLPDLVSPVEQKQKKMILGRFGRAPQSFFRRIRSIWDPDQFANSANTAMMIWNHRLFGLYEAGFPTEIDSITLKKIKVEDFGVLKRAFSAHPKFIPCRRETINFGFRVFPRPSLDIFSFPQSGRPSQIGSLPYNGATFVHDFAATENFLVFFLSPVFVNPIDMIIRGHSLAECMKFDFNKKTVVLIANRENLNKVTTINIDPMLYTHTANAYEEEGYIVIDGITYKDGTNLEWINSVRYGNQPFETSRGRLTHFKINPNKATISWRFGFEGVEVPQINARYFAKKNRFTYCAAYHQTQKSPLGFYKSIVRIDGVTEEVKIYFEDDDQVFSEPLFVPSRTREEEGDGYVITLNQDLKSGRAYCGVYCFKETPKLLGKLWFSHGLPPTFHGVWWSQEK